MKAHEFEFLNVDGTSFYLNQKARPRFGEHRKTKQKALTLCLIEMDHEDEKKRTRWRVSWYGDELLGELASLAYKHDHGINHKRLRQDLKFSDAVITPTRYSEDKRPHTAARKASKTNNPVTGQAPRLHNRFRCDPNEGVGS